MIKKIPMRRCVGCMEQKSKRELIRVVRSPEGEISLDTTGKKPGRGAYLCPDPECLAKAQKAGGWNGYSPVRSPPRYMNGSGRSWNRMNDSLLPSIGLARKAGKLILGFDAVSTACKNGTAALVLLSEDLSPKSRKEIVRIAQQYEIRWFDAPFQMGDIDRLLHKRAGILAVSDEGFVRMFLKHLPAHEKEDQTI